MAPVQGENRQMLVVYAAALLAVALIGARYLKSAAAEQGAGRTESVARFGGASAATGGSGFSAPVVYVSGAVRRPGIVRMREGDRVADAVEAAGGAARSADLSAVNLAARIADGQQIVVPRRAGDSAGGATGAVSLATASLDQLDALDGVGPGLAQKIVEYRAQHGGFKSVDELGEVPGIGEKRLESLRAQLQP